MLTLCVCVCVCGCVCVCVCVCVCARARKQRRVRSHAALNSCDRPRVPDCADQHVPLDCSASHRAQSLLHSATNAQWLTSEPTHSQISARTSTRTHKHKNVLKHKRNRAIHSSQVQANLDGILAHTFEPVARFVPSINATLPAGYVSASLPGKPWTLSMWPRDGGACVRA
jgi:hypothetical protein